MYKHVTYIFYLVIIIYKVMMNIGIKIDNSYYNILWEHFLQMVLSITYSI